MHQKATIAEVTYQFSEKFIGGLAIGAIIDGTFKESIYQSDIQRGGLLSVKVMWVRTFKNPTLPFIVTSISFTASNVSTKSQSMYTNFIGTDLRLGATIGYTIKKVLQVYISPKVFGGPIFYQSNTDKLQGRDLYFFQAGLGSSLFLPKDFTLFVNGSVAGEQAISFGIAKGF